VVPDAYFLPVSRIREGVCFVTTDTTHIQGKRGRIEEILPISYPVLQAG